MSINFFLGTALYLVIGFLFMITSAKLGWIRRYDPAIFFWIGWPIVILFGIFTIPARITVFLVNWVEDFIRPIRKNTNEPKKKIKYR